MHFSVSIFGFTRTLRCKSIHLQLLSQLWYTNILRGISSNGRAPAQHAGGTGIDTRILQQYPLFFLFSVYYCETNGVSYQSILLRHLIFFFGWLFSETSFKYLGVVFRNLMSWKALADQVCQMVASRVKYILVRVSSQKIQQHLRTKL